jgi:two-component system sensor histidine kinase YesM
MLVLMPMLLILLVMGLGFSLITRQYTKDEMNRHNFNLLNQSKDNVDMVLNELDTLNVSFSHSPRAVAVLEDLLNEDSLQYDSLSNMDMIRSFIEAPAASRPFIHSIYVYYKNDLDHFFSTDEGITSTRQYYDKSWLDILDAGPPGATIIQIRQIQRYHFESSQQIVSVSRILEQNGLIVMNIKPSYFASLFVNLSMSPNQTVIIADNERNLIFNNDDKLKLDREQLLNILNQSKNIVGLSIQGKQYVATKVKSVQFGWEYISIVPEKELYKLPNLLNRYTLLLFLAALLLATLISISLTRRNTNSIMEIVHILDSAELEEEELNIRTVRRLNDVYGYIIHRMIRSFIEHRYMKVQLSERKYRIQAMQLQALQSQVAPHFLYNTLETINWKVIAMSKGPNEVSVMIKSLSEILNYSLNNSDTLISIKDEIHYCKAYIQIQQVRYRDKFSISWGIAPHVDGLFVTRLLIQPLLENCIYHGIKPKVGSAGIRVTLYRKGDMIELNVLDSGMGMSRTKLQEVRNGLTMENEITKHIGLLNTWRRIKLVYQDKCEIRVISKYNWGTKITLRLPVSLENASIHK